MRIVFDTSALAKRYLVERGTARVVELCGQADEIVVSVLCVPEMFSGLNRLRRDGSLSAEQYRRLKREFAADLVQAAVVAITPSVLTKAIAALEASALRALDAVHVATAQDSSCDLFVSADLRQCGAAKALGLTIEHVG